LYNHLYKKPTAIRKSTFLLLISVSVQPSKGQGKIEVLCDIKELAWKKAEETWFSPAIES
jgi:hypothetical protein